MCRPKTNSHCHLGFHTQFFRRSLRTIYEREAFANTHLQQYEAAQQAYEKALPLALAFSIDDLLDVSRRVLYLAIFNKHYLESLEVGRNLAEHGVASAKDMAALSRSYFNLLDCKYAIIWADRSVETSDKVGESPDGLLLNIKSDC